MIATLRRRYQAFGSLLDGYFGSEEGEWVDVATLTLGYPHIRVRWAPQWLDFARQSSVLYPGNDRVSLLLCKLHTLRLKLAASILFS